jgi:hypothetical protein
MIASGMSSHDELRRYHGRSTGISIIPPPPRALAEYKLSKGAEAEHVHFPSMHAHAVDFYDHAPSGFAFGHGNIAHDDARL